jgi:hypothetical protein
VTGWRAGRVALIAIRLLILLAMLVPGLPAMVGAQTPMASPAATIATLDASADVTVNFPVGLTIRAELAWVGDDISGDIELLYAVAGDETENLVLVDGEVSGDGTPTSVEATLDLQAQFVPPGVEIAYRWQVVDGSRVIAASDVATTQWYDTRFDWQEAATDQVTIHYYDLEPGFADEIAASAQATVTDLEARFRLDRSAPLSIWVYPNASDFQAAKPPNSRETIAGASFPGYFVIMAVVPEGSTGEVGRVILHELSHQVLYQATRNPFSRPPLWFDEGLATHVQVGGTDGYLGMAATALANGALFNLDSIDDSFPYVPSQATLAYAASWSAVEYIMRTYGDDGIAALIAAFATGAPQDEAIEQALGVDMVQLNDDWHSWLAAQPA